ncbi:transposase [Streptomyces goshikiensis]|uniref:transposase n=1 Tax=Streptomyces goshikiensis TaxID=1942 RepID=UPI003698F543
MAAGLKRYEAEHDWLTIVRLPAYAPDLHPVEAVWSLVHRATANTAFDTSDDLDRTSVTTGWSRQGQPLEGAGRADRSAASTRARGPRTPLLLQQFTG